MVRKALGNLQPGQVSGRQTQQAQELSNASTVHAPLAGQRPLGIGMLYRSLEDVLSLVPKAMREEVQDVLLRYPDCQQEYGHELFKCPACDRPAGRFHFKVTYGDGQVLEPTFQCGHCRTALEVADTPDDIRAPGALADWPSPRCGEKGLEGQELLLWD